MVDMSQQQLDAVTIVIPTLNAGPLLSKVLDAIADQEAPFAFQVLAVDSGSTDETLDLLNKRGVRISSIDGAEFNHGTTRSKAAIDLCETPLVAFLSQDAVPFDSNWLHELAMPLADERVAGSHAVQRPAIGAHPFQLVNAQRLSEGQQTFLPFTAAEFAALNPSERLARISFDNVSSMVRRDVLAEHPFPHCMFGEDLRWAREVLSHGHRLVRCGAARVTHSHSVNTAEFKDRARWTHSLSRINLLRVMTTTIQTPNIFVTQISDHF